MRIAATDPTWPTYRRLLRYTIKYWWVLLGSVLGYALYSVLQPLMADFAKFLVATLENPEPSRVLLLCVAPLAFVVAQGIGHFIGSYCIAWLGQHLVFELRNDVFRHMLALPQDVFQKNASGRLMSKIIFDAQQITAAGSDAVTIILREGMVVISLLAYLLWSNWKLTLILFTVGPMIGLVVNVTSKRFREISRRIQKSMGNITQYLGEAIEGIQVIKIFGGQKPETDRFEAVARRFEKNNVKIVTTKVASTILVQMTVATGVGVIIYLYTRFMQEGLAVGDFLSYIIAVSMTQKPIKQLTEVNVKIQRGVTGAASLFELLDTESERDTGTRPLQRARGDIEFVDVRFGYQPDTPVLKGLSFTIEAGQTVALVGRSGAGKSTISSLLPRFHDPDGGQILLDGVPLCEYRLADLRRQFAMVSQKVVLFNDSVRNNIAYGELSEATDEQIREAARNAFALDFIEQLPKGFGTSVGQDGTQLSGGQRQRLAITRALLKDAPVLIMDEATSALDTESEFRIQKALERVMEGRTTLVIAHRLSTIEKADRILVLDEGRLVESGTHQELLDANGFYTQLYRMNFAE